MLVSNMYPVECCILVKPASIPLSALRHIHACSHMQVRANRPCRTHACIPDVRVVFELLLCHGPEFTITVTTAQQHKLSALVQAPAGRQRCQAPLDTLGRLDTHQCSARLRLTQWPTIKWVCEVASEHCSFTRNTVSSKNIQAKLLQQTCSMAHTLDLAWQSAAWLQG